MGETIPLTMRAVEIAEPGGPEVLRLTSRPTPEPGPDEVLVRVRAAGLNRGDLMQRRGLYAPPPGFSDLPGLEVAGEVAALGADVEGWSVGDAVCALLAGGGYAEYSVVPALQCLPQPQGFTAVQAAAVPETLFTCWTTLIDDGRLKAGETLLVHGGSSGIGTTAIPLAKALGAKVFVTAGSDAKCAACLELGAELAVNYKTQDFVDVIAGHTSGRGVDVVLDMVGGDYVARDLQIMASRGRHVSIGLLGGLNATIPMPYVLMKALTITGSTLRGRTPAEKGAIADRLKAMVWPMLEDGRIAPVVHATYPLGQAAEAHRALEEGDHIGKIVLTV